MHVENDIAVVGDEVLSINRSAAQLNQGSGHGRASHGNDFYGQRELAEGVLHFGCIDDADKGFGH